MSDAWAHIRGQEHAKRALEVALAGRHSVLLVGPAGAGKTLLARAVGRLGGALVVDDVPDLSRPALIDLRSPEDAARLLGPEMADLDQEQLRVLLLDTRHQVVRQVEIYRGTVNTSIVRVAEVFREALRENCPAILIAHNHPSSGGAVAGGRGLDPPAQRGRPAA